MRYIQIFCADTLQCILRIRSISSFSSALALNWGDYGMQCIGELHIEYSYILCCNVLIDLHRPFHIDKILNNVL